MDELTAFPLDTDDPLRSLNNAPSVPRMLVDHGRSLTAAPERTTEERATWATLGDTLASLETTAARI